MTDPVGPAYGGASVPRNEPPSPDIAPPAAETALPGAHRGGFARLPTAPVEVTSAPADAGEQPYAPVQWAVAEPAPPRGLAGWALAFAVGGLAFALFVGWAFPLGLVGIVVAVLALRRPFESRAVAVWALVLGLLSVLYSAGWLLWAAGRADMLS
ncbi:hypothetical protein [Microbacterium sp. P01]|uniref:hypothetical protein n=1 Tax=unclassified Microbacterium TaxID=2609290 RepID=UPI00366E02C8